MADIASHIKSELPYANRSLPNVSEQFHRSTPDPLTDETTSGISHWRSLTVGELRSTDFGPSTSSSNSPTRSAVEVVVSLAQNESLSDPETDSENGYPETKRPRADSGHSDKTGLGVLEKAFDELTDGSPVEIVLIDRSRKNVVRKLRIDEHMNVSYWTEEGGTERVIAGVSFFVFVVLITVITLSFAFR